MFNFFKKKQVIAPPTIEGILCIPGPWKDHKEILHAIVEATSGEYLFAGMVLMNTKTNEAVKMFVEPKDASLKEKFQHTGLINNVSTEFLKQIDQHEHVVYLAHELGSFDRAKTLAFAGNALLQAGGFGINVDTCNKGFEKAHWMDLVTSFQEHSLYEMFVHDAIKDTRGYLFSCGMQHLGLKDTMIYNQAVEEAHSTLKIWGNYQVIDKPTIKVGQTFSIAANAPRFRILKEKNPPYKEHELLHNPFGMWRLKPLE